MYVREYHPLSTCHFISMLWMKPGLFRAEHTYGVNNRITLRLKEKGGQHLKRGKVKKRAWWKGLPAIVREKSCRRTRKKQPSTLTSRKRQPALFIFIWIFLLVNIDQCAFIHVDINQAGVLYWLTSTRLQFSTWSTLVDAVDVHFTALFITL